MIIDGYLKMKRDDVSFVACSVEDDNGMNEQRILLYSLQEFEYSLIL